MTPLTAEMIAELERLQYDYQLREKRRELEMTHRRAVASICNSMASFNMVGAVFVEDPKLAAKMFDNGIRWQMKAAMAHAGVALVEIVGGEEGK